LLTYDFSILTKIPQYDKSIQSTDPRRFNNSDRQPFISQQTVKL